MMKVNSRKFKFLLFIVISVFPLLFCSTGYITPDSLTATAAPQMKTSVPTAFFILPTGSPTSEPPSTNTSYLDSLSSTPSPNSTLVGEESQTPTATLGNISADRPSILYYAQSGDTISALAKHFGVNEFEIISEEDIPQTGFLLPGQMLMIPNRLAHTTTDTILIPDSEIVFSSSASNFDINKLVDSYGGKLSSYKEYVIHLGIGSGAEIIEFISNNNSLNPRMLLGLLQYQSNWVFGQPTTLSQEDFPYGNIIFLETGLHKQLNWAVDQLSFGYYSWREGSLTHLNFPDGNSIRLAPNLNAGTVSIMYFFSQIYDYDQWLNAIDPDIGFPHYYNEIFGNSWVRAAKVEPLLPTGLSQPPITLPFFRNQLWSFSGGPHGAWRATGSMAAIDFAPGAIEKGCVDSESWVVANVSGSIARLGVGVVVIDLDGDGDEHTGWNIAFLHLDNTDHLKVGQWVELGDFIGNPSCKGGYSTGPHIHITRKYNGEWLDAGGAIPFNLGGWVAEAGDNPYDGYLRRENETVDTVYTKIVRTDRDP